MTTPASVLRLRSAFQLCSKARLSRYNVENALALRRTFRSSACRREQYLDANEEVSHVHPPRPYCASSLCGVPGVLPDKGAKGDKLNL